MIPTIATRAVRLQYIGWGRVMSELGGGMEPPQLHESPPRSHCFLYVVCFMGRGLLAWVRTAWRSASL
jgi:hypothetical protein